MPTGYTAAIADGITFEKFVLTCARAFGATIEMRDEPMDKEIPEFVASDYHANKLIEAEVELQKLNTLTQDEWVFKTFADHKEGVERIEKRNAEKLATRTKYDNMLLMINAWTPPTNEHKGLKDFMIQQITDSIKWDCEPTKIPEIQCWADYRADVLKAAERDVNYCRKGAHDELTRTAERNKWVSDLKASLLTP